jgi:GTPase SAR1 family protein
MLLSRNFTQSDWAQYEGATFLFRDPQNRRLQFVPVQLENLASESVPFSIRHFARLDWIERGAAEFQKVVEACRRGGESASPQTQLATESPAPQPKPPTTEPTSDARPPAPAELKNLLSLGHSGYVWSVAVTPDGQSIVSAATNCVARQWQLRGGGRRGGGPGEPVATRYTNAKVLLVGESGVGKTGLARWMATGQFEKTESTDAHWATRLSAEQQVHHNEDWATRLMLKGDVDEAGTRREIWLWDFAGQADYRLIHQLFMDETSLAVLVFNPQTEQLFDSLGRWDTDIARAARKEYRKLLVAGRIDRGNLRASRDDLDAFLATRNFDGYLETSAKDGTGCAELVNAICNSIDWDRLTMTVSNVTWDRMKNEILAIRDGRSTPNSSSGRRVADHRRTDHGVAGVECSEPPEDDASEEEQTGCSLRLDPSHPESEVHAENTVTDGEARVLANAATKEANDGNEPTILIRLSELNQRLRMTAPELSYKPEELVAVVDALARPGLVWKLDFGGFVLLHPDRINSYAGAVARELRNRQDQLGVMAEDRLTRGDFDMAGVQRVSSEDETVLLQAMHQTFVDRGLALRQKTGDGTQLVFPAYFGAKRPEEPDSPPLFATYEFSGFLDDVYATLVVRLYYSTGFEMDRLWRDYAQFHSETGRRLCIELTRGREGRGSLKLHCEAGTADDTRVLFSRYVHEHLAGKAHDVERSRHYACPTCGKPFLDDDEVREAMSEDGEDAFVFCSGRKCREKIPLWDAIEQKFASDEFRDKVRRLHEASKQAIDNESRELILIGHAFSIAGEAGQIFRPVANSDWGIDGEIEFKDYAGNLSDKRVYLQLKHGDSYLTPRKRDGGHIFRIKNPRWADYWIAHEYPVMLVIRTSDGRIRWVNATEELKQLKDAGHWPVTQIGFAGEDFNPYNLLQIRRHLLGPPPLPEE